MMEKVTRLYLHFPFCARRCDYCDFFSTTGKLDLAQEYVDALLIEAESCIHMLGPLETMYLGGGTPTLLGSELLVRLLDGLNSQLRAGAEVSIEANPASMTSELARSLRGAGVNRVTLGVQSFDEGLRGNLGRDGSSSKVAEALRMLRVAGFDNIGLDMIFGIPGQDARALERDLDKALLFEPEHISYYELSYERGGRYHRRWERELRQIEPLLPSFYETVVDSLQAAGYGWYETSNFALPGYECGHNRAYWQGRDYLGLGTGAWSTVGRDRWRNVEDLETYLAAAGDWDYIRRHERVSDGQKLRERLILGLRRLEGVQRQVVEPVLNEAQEQWLLQHGFLVREGGRIWLTRPGRLLADDICVRLLQD